MRFQVLMCERFRAFRFSRVLGSVGSGSDAFADFSGFTFSKHTNPRGTDNRVNKDNRGDRQEQKNRLHMGNHSSDNPNSR